MHYFGIPRTTQSEIHINIYIYIYRSIWLGLFGNSQPNLCLIEFSMSPVRCLLVIYFIGNDCQQKVGKLCKSIPNFWSFYKPGWNWRKGQFAKMQENKIRTAHSNITKGSQHSILIIIVWGGSNDSILITCVTDICTTLCSFCSLVKISLIDLNQPNTTEAHISIFMHVFCL